MHDSRLITLQVWLEKILAPKAFTISKLAGDASFRRYFRVHLENRTLVAMDAPPAKEDSRPFVAIAKALGQHGVTVPEIIATDLEQGFLLLSDLGDRLYLGELHADNADHLYKQALSVIPQIHRCREIQDWSLPHFGDQIIVNEFKLFLEWFLKNHLELVIDHPTELLLNNCFEILARVVNEQPQVPVHRDYHSRNLLRLKNDGVGVLDFQDAVLGPITYDAVSLLRDCYIAWPLTQVHAWALLCFEQDCDSGLVQKNSPEQYLQWFDYTGLQRHLKVLGIFSRLHHRDGKNGYLKEMPRILAYVNTVCENYPELKPLHLFFNQHVTPKIMMS